MADIQNNAPRHLAEAQSPEAGIKHPEAGIKHPQVGIKQLEEKPQSYSVNEKNHYAALGADSFSYPSNRFDQRAGARFGSSLVCR